jgi:hypothetical protein
MPNRQKLFTTLITRRITFSGPTQLCGKTEYVKWAHEVCVGLTIIFFNKLPENVIKVFYLPTDVQENCFKKNIKIYFKKAATCFGAITIIRERHIGAC